MKATGKPDAGNPHVRFDEGEGTALPTLLKDRLRLFLLPPYSPELNPDEWVWNHLKNNGIGRQVIHTKPQMKRAVISHMKSIQKSPDLICSFFQAETTRYAA